MSDFERSYPEFPSGYDAWKTTDRYAEEMGAYDDDPPAHTNTLDCDVAGCEGECAGSDDKDDELVRDGHAAVGPHAAWASKYDRDWDDGGDR
jgi:hypothetical protein